MRAVSWHAASPLLWMALLVPAVTACDPASRSFMSDLTMPPDASDDVTDDDATDDDATDDDATDDDATDDDATDDDAPERGDSGFLPDDESASPEVEPVQADAGFGPTTMGPIRLVGGFVPLRSPVSADIRLQGEMVIQRRACNVSRSICVRGGFTP